MEWTFFHVKQQKPLENQPLVQRRRGGKEESFVTRYLQNFVEL